MEEKTTERELLQQEQIEGTPFTAVRLDDKWFLTMGKYRLSEPTKTFEEVLEEAKDASWFRIMQLIQIMIEEHEKNKLKTNNLKN